MKNTKYTYQHPHPAVAVDCVVFGLDDENLHGLLIKRGVEPFENCWALPGGFVKIDEELEAAAIRELEEETGISPKRLTQVGVFGGVDRDPRERVISIAYYALVNLWDHKVQAATDAKDAAWFPLDDRPKLAFDHKDIIDYALEELRKSIQYHPIGLDLLPKEFSLSTLQHLYETVLGKSLDKRNFRKKILSTDLLIGTGRYEKDVAHRAAQLYRFDMGKFNKLNKAGFGFQV